MYLALVEEQQLQEECVCGDVYIGARPCLCTRVNPNCTPLLSWTGALQEKYSQGRSHDAGELPCLMCWL